jgi:hypothetical protein
MKKVLVIALLFGIGSLVACGPSAEEKAADEKRVQDSIAAADAAMKAAEEAAMAAAVADSSAQMDTTAAPVAK